VVFGCKWVSRCLCLWPGMTGFYGVHIAWVFCFPMEGIACMVEVVYDMGFGAVVSLNAYDSHMIS
jgi:hypothetical protein